MEEQWSWWPPKGRRAPLVKISSPYSQTKQRVQVVKILNELGIPNIIVDVCPNAEISSGDRLSAEAGIAVLSFASTTRIPNFGTIEHEFSNAISASIGAPNAVTQSYWI